MKKLNYKRFSASMLVLVTIFTGLFFQSCEDTDEQPAPEIMYIRKTDPAKSDSLVVHAFMGDNIAIIGKNLGNVDEIWFNDQRAALNPNLVTETSIIVQVPEVIPAEVTNKMTLINSDKVKKLQYDFGVDVPAPLVDRMVCEYVADGETAVIKGNYFVDDPASPLTVLFPGNIAGTIESLTINEIRVTVPAGTGPGQIQVKSLYGTTRSRFFFRDDRGIILNFDDLTAAGGWRSGVIGNSNPEPVDGNYVRFSGALAGGAGSTWNEDGFSFNLWPSANGRPDVPVYTGELKDGQIKFEVNVVAPWQSAALQMIFTAYSVSGTNGYIADYSYPRGLWNPWKETGSYQTDGWITVSFPLSDFNYTFDGAESANKLMADMISGLTFYVWHGGVAGTDCNPHICIDNIRVIPK
ncbi:MAG: glycan-binding surface protein [Bacteroidales bacterium]|nr:glycan-binding surface protein [Bacteroidales bacterium]MDT8374470.1 glycan-binding surface protein [Bacteroidales bacterium]